MITLSIDASTKSTGIAIFNEGKLIHYECIKSNNTDIYVRIGVMVKRICQLCNTYKPTDIIMQDVLPENVNHNQAVYKALMYLQAAIVLQLHKIELTVKFCTASHWRAEVGIHTGRGRKRQQLKLTAQRLVKHIYNIDVNDDISDAICIGIAYIKEHRSAF